MKLATLFLFVFLLATQGLSRAQETGDSNQNIAIKRSQILKEIESANAPVWSGIYERGGWELRQLCIAPHGGIVESVVHEDRSQTFMASGDIIDFEEGRLKVRWNLNRGDAMSTDLVIVPVTNKLVVVPTGDIHRFYLELGKHEKSLGLFFQKTLAKPRLEEYQIAEYLSSLSKSFPLIGRVTQVVSKSAEKKDGKTVEYQQTVKVDLGRTSGVFVGLILEQGHIGSRVFSFKVVEVNDDHCIATAHATVGSRVNFSRVGDSVTSGSMRSAFDR